MVGIHKPEGLASDGTYTKGHVVRVNGEPPRYLDGSSIANLEALRYKVERVDFKRKTSSHVGRGARD